MPTTKVQSPSGQVIEVSHPEGATQEQIIAFAKGSPQGEPQQPERSPLVNIQEGAKQGLQRAAVGGAQASAAVIEALSRFGILPPSGAASGAQELTQEQLAREKAAFPQGIPQEADIARDLGALAPALALPGSTLPQALVGGAVAGGTAFSEDPSAAGTAQQAGTGAAISGTLQQALPPAARAAAKAGQFGVSFAKNALDKLSTKTRALEGITKAGTRQARTSAERLGTFVTPAEASGDVLALLREGELRLTTTTQRNLLTKLDEREAIIQKEIKELMSGLVPEGAEANKAAASALFDDAFATPLPPQAKEFLTNQSTVLGKFLGKTTRDIKSLAQQEGLNLQPGTIGELHATKILLDDAIGIAQKAGKKGQVRGLVKAKGLLTDMADTLAESYPLARAVSQRRIIQDSMKRSLDKAKAGEETGTSNFFKTFLKKGEDRKQIMDQLNNVLEGQIGRDAKVKLLNIDRVLRSIDKSSVEKTVRRAALSPKLQAEGGSVRTRQVNSLIGFFEGAFDEKLVNYITNPKWETDLIKAVSSKKSSQARATALVNMLSRIGAEEERSQREAQTIPEVP